MTHNFQRGSWMEEAAITLGTGSIYGAVNTLVGHPLDTVKTRMQTLSTANGGIVSVSQQIMKESGVRGFFKGCIPPLWGSMVFRSVQFSVFEAVYTKLSSDDSMKEKSILGLFEPRVLFAGMAAASIRPFLEAPIEYAKIQGQNNQPWRIRDLYRGAHLQWFRTAPYLTMYFLGVDFGRVHTNLMNSWWGQLTVAGGSAAGALLVVWPLETLKNRAQAGTAVGNWKQDLKHLGVKGIFRGSVAGLLSTFLRNGVAMIAMQEMNKAVRNWKESRAATETVKETVKEELVHVKEELSAAAHAAHAVVAANVATHTPHVQNVATTPRTN